MIRFEDVERKVERHHPDADLELLRRAYIYSAKSHKDQVRASGEPYLIHPLSVAQILADMKLDVPTVCTGLLHDVVEDTLATIEDIESLFGKDVAMLVDGVTKISNLGKVSKEEAQAENLRKMVLAMVGDIRVVLVKLADRSHNMRTLGYLKPEKRKRIAEETLEVYAPIAHRLGMSKIRAELEDLSFQYLHPEEYKRLREDVERRRASTEHFLDEVKSEIAARLTENDVPYVRIEGRIKRLYSIFLKLQRQKISLDKVYDLAAVRIITREPRDCYFVLGVMHEYWKPFNDRIKDFIAKPRENGYQSLHTSVIGDEGYHFEVQIRTEEMHEIAEEGVAAHWKYKEGKGRDSSEDETMKWLRRLIEWQQDVPDAREFVDSFKLELYPKEVYALTPKGKVIQLPANSTPVDFAYAVHTDLGDECTGARVHGRIVPLRYQVQNGDKIEIIRTPGHQPSRDWLNFVVTSKARNQVKKFIAEKQRAESLELGRKMFDKEVVRLRMKPKAMPDDPQLRKYMADNGYAKFDDLLAAIGYGKVTVKSVLARLVPEERLAELDRARTSGFQKATRVVKRVLRLGDDRISIKGNIDGVMYYRAPCCNPIRGEEIIGYITIGKGVGVHARRCKNAENLLVNRERIIEVSWEGAGDLYPVKLSVLTLDRTGQLAALTNKIAEIKTNIRSASTDDDSLNDGTRKIELTVDVNDVAHLDRVLVALKGIEGVLEVERLNSLPPHN
jgi:GTP diphosphokinase / guanosine-3',5'-bis(diphosphate) 3'-diphosphatase